MPVSSLPGAYGIGCFSKEAYEFVDFLAKTKTRYWQILPLGQTSYGDSPYQSFSTFAGNPYFIDLNELIAKGFLKKTECDGADFGDNEEYIDYGIMYESRYAILRKAFKRAVKKSLVEDRDFLKFKKKNVEWLFDYALFMALKDAHGGASWDEWEDELRMREKEALEAAAGIYAIDIEFYSWLQYLFYTQWKALKKYANKAGVKIIGDIPIYVSFDSSDAWANPELFWFDADRRPVRVAGCPPDSFAKEGQLWGNPLYDWKYHESTGYQWWIKRMKSCGKLYDMVRIDHFRGFDEYYTIPYGDENAVNGEWVKGPGYALFEAVKAKLGDIDVIVEDLGFITDSVRRLVKKTGWPNMKIIEFGFGGGDDTGKNEYLTCNYDKNCVVYTGTHDNDTLEGWHKEADSKDIAKAVSYLGLNDNEGFVWGTLRGGMSSVANLFVAQMQDYLGLDSGARINTPGKVDGNWQWRVLPNFLSPELAESIRQLADVYQRLPSEEEE